MGLSFIDEFFKDRSPINDSFLRSPFDHSSNFSEIIRLADGERESELHRFRRANAPGDSVSLRVI